jgi:hypothetical protein
MRSNNGATLAPSLCVGTTTPAKAENWSIGPGSITWRQHGLRGSLMRAWPVALLLAALGFAVTVGSGGAPSQVLISTQGATSATTTVAPTTTTTTEAPDPDLGRKLSVRPAESTGDVFQQGPVWIGVVFGLAAAGGIFFALTERRPEGWSHSGWPRRKRSKARRRARMRY